MSQHSDLESTATSARVIRDESDPVGVYGRLLLVLIVFRKSGGGLGAP